MKLWKLTDENDQTHGGCQWGKGVTIETSGEGKLCGSGWTHWYTHPLLAVLLNPIHGNFDLDKAHLWEGEGEPEKLDDGLKVGCKRATTTKRVRLPKVTTEQKVRFGILCAKKKHTDVSWNVWADKWLSGEDRSQKAARAAAARAAKAAEAAAWAAKGDIDLITLAKQATQREGRKP